MPTTIIKLGPDIELHMEPPSDHVSIAGNIVSAIDTTDIARKVYFSVEGPKVWGRSGNENYLQEDSEACMPATHVSWKMAQHDRRYWQSGFSVKLGVDSADYCHEIELTEQQSQAISQYFL